MIIKQIYPLIPLIIMAVCLTTGCGSKAHTPYEITVNQHLDIAIYQYDENSGSFDPDSALMAESVLITNLVHYQSDGDSITVPFNFADVSEYSKITADNTGRRIAITANGNLVSTPMVTMQLDNGACSFTIPKNKAATLFPNENLNKLP